MRLYEDDGLNEKEFKALPVSFVVIPFSNIIIKTCVRDISLGSIFQIIRVFDEKYLTRNPIQVFGFGCCK